MTGVKILDALEEDLPAIVEIYNSTVPSRMVTADPEPVSVESRRAWFREHDPKSRPLWVADADGEVIGWLSFEPFRERPVYHPTAEVSVYVSAEHRRKGVGQRLLEAANRRAPELGLKTLTGDIFGHNEPSIRLFEGFGFERWAHYLGSRCSTASSGTWSCWACASTKRVNRLGVCNRSRTSGDLMRL
jgi:L-amino acid N-acyltransferase YncA